MRPLAADRDGLLGLCANAPAADLSGVPQKIVDGDTSSARLRFALKALMRPKPIRFVSKRRWTRRISPGH